MPLIIFGRKRNQKTFLTCGNPQKQKQKKKNNKKKNLDMIIDTYIIAHNNNNPISSLPMPG